MKSLVILFSVLSISLLSFNSYSKEVTKGGIHPLDNRVAKSSSSPALLDAVGRLNITDSKGRETICSGTLMGLTSDEDSRVVLTAAHCLTNGPMIWETTTKSGKTIKLATTILKYDHGADWAILLLERKVSNADVKPLLLDYEWEDDFDSVAYNYEPEALYVAGYSADREIGRNGKVLTYDDRPEAISTSNSIAGGEVESFIYGGASGGAVIVAGVDLENEEGNFGKQNYLIGVLKGGSHGIDHTSSNGNGGQIDTVFSQYGHFLNEVKEATSKYNK